MSWPNLKGCNLHQYRRPTINSARSLNPLMCPRDTPVIRQVARYLEAEICELEDTGKIESFDDPVRHTYDHKIGGYPSLCQSGIDSGDGFEFVFQLSSDAEVNLNVMDCGSLMFWKNGLSGKRIMYCNFIEYPVEAGVMFGPAQSRC
ncbi:DUF1963 domain-containing protein [Pseudomonas syringae]|uniref:DUF1963 domain-containing protein n=1 Tax=Pseudomonas syringae TaxID=317 RepID=UPI003D35947A